jgi:hypothetical protein
MIVCADRGQHRKTLNKWAAMRGAAFLSINRKPDAEFWQDTVRGVLYFLCNHHVVGQSNVRACTSYRLSLVIDTTRRLPDRRLPGHPSTLSARQQFAAAAFSSSTQHGHSGKAASIGAIDSHQTSQ